MSRTPPTQRMRHGITSRGRGEARFYEVMELAGRLARPADACPLVNHAALELADAILHLTDITTAQLALMSHQLLPDTASAATATDGVLRDLSLMMAEAHRLKVMSSYAIKARSWPATA
jgi:hypothetical protein